MRKWVWPLFWVLLGTTGLSAQTGPTLWIRHLIPVRDAGNVVVSSDGKAAAGQVRLLFFTKRGRVVGVKDIALITDTYHLTYHETFVWRDTVQVLLSTYDPQRRKMALILRRYDLPTLRPAGEFILREWTTALKATQPFAYALSPNSSRLALYTWTWRSAEQPASFTLSVLDHQLDPIWEQDYRLPFPNNQLNIQNILVDDCNQIYLVSAIYDRPMGVKPNPDDRQYAVLIAEGQPDQVIRYDLGFPTQSLIGLRTLLDDQQRFTCFAFFNERGKRIHQGIYTGQISKLGEPIEQSLIAISVDRYDKAYSLPDKEGPFTLFKHPFRYYQVDRVFPNTDGTWTIVGEQRLEITNSTEVQYNDILLITVDSSRKKLKWMQRIVKRQDGYLMAYSPFSYAVVPAGRSFLVFVNDAPENYPRRKGRQELNQFYSIGRSRRILHRIGPSGHLTTRDLTPFTGGARVSYIFPGYTFFNPATETVYLYGEGQDKEKRPVGILFDFELADLLED